MIEKIPFFMSVFLALLLMFVIGTGLSAIAQELRLIREVLLEWRQYWQARTPLLPSEPGSFSESFEKAFKEGMASEPPKAQAE